MKSKIKNNENKIKYFFILVSVVASMLGLMEVRASNNLSYADNNILVTERIKFLLEYGGESIPLFIIGLALAIKAKSKKWAVINGLAICSIVVYIFFSIALISAFRNFHLQP